MQGIAPVVLFVLAFVLAGFPHAAPAHAVDTEIIVVQKDAPKAGRAKGPAPGGPKDPKALWWNDPGIVKGLSVTEEQRKRIETILAAYRKDLPREKGPADFHEALVQGSWKDARAANKKLAELAATSIRTRGQLKIDILSVLSKEQYKLLVDRYPRLIYRPWSRAMRGAPR